MSKACTGELGVGGGGGQPRAHRKPWQARQRATPAATSSSSRATAQALRPLGRRRSTGTRMRRRSAPAVRSARACNTGGHAARPRQLPQRAGRQAARDATPRAARHAPAARLGRGGRRRRARDATGAARRRRWPPSSPRAGHPSSTLRKRVSGTQRASERRSRSAARVQAAQAAGQRAPAAAASRAAKTERAEADGVAQSAPPCPWGRTEEMTWW